MKNCIVLGIAFLLMIPIMPFNEPFGFIPVMPHNQLFLANIWIIPAIVYIIVVSLKKEKKSTAKRTLAIFSEVFKSFLKTFFCFFVFTVAFYLIFASIEVGMGIEIEITQIALSNLMYMLIFFLLVQNIALKSPGYYLLELRIENFSLISKLKILLLNFYKFVPFYIFILEVKFKINSNILWNLTMLIMIIFVIDVGSRFFVLNCTSLVEKAFRIEILSDKAPSVPLMHIPRNRKL